MYYILRINFSIIFSDKIPSFERKYGCVNEGNLTIIILISMDTDFL